MLSRDEVFEVMGYALNFKWKNKLLVVDTSSEESIKRVCDYTGLVYCKVMGRLVLYDAEQYALKGNLFQYVGSSTKPNPIINAEVLDSLFEGCTLEELDLSDWKVSTVVSINRMFANCENLKSINFAKWDLKNLVSFNGIFDGSGKIDIVTKNNFYNILV